jgi:hypothetical protein
LSIALLLSLNAQVAYAGSLNENEAAVVSAAQGTFEHNGIKYQTDPVFVQQLISYLNQDDVDLNASQKDEAISMMFSNVGQGVAEGYLVPISGQDEQENPEEQKNNEQNNEEKSNSDNQGPDNSTESNTNHGENTGADITGDGSSAEASDGKEDKGNKEQDILNEIRKQPATKTEVDQNKNKVTVKKEDNSSVIVFNTVIKNTGFNLSPALATLAGLITAFIFCVIVTVKCNFFRQEE